MTKDRSMGALIGLAVGDALGTSVEFMERDDFDPVVGMRGGGVFQLNPGEWTDDTSMALALAESIIASKGFDSADLLTRFCKWYEEGEYSHNGKCFDIGMTTQDALNTFRFTGNPDPAKNLPHLNGNGSLMRLSPAPIAWRKDRDAAVLYSDLQGKTTHAADKARECCRELGGIIWDLLNGAPLDTAIPNVPALQRITRNNISSRGYCLDTLIAAKWCVATTDSFSEAVLLAANLGDDADTVAAVTGQIAGALYGYSAIPAEWLKVLVWHDYMVDLATKLHDLFGE